MVVLLNLLLYRNSFCGIFRQASVLQASCRSASFRGMEVVKGSDKKADPRQGCNTGCCFQLAAGSVRLPPRSCRVSTDVVLSLYTCFSLYLPWKSEVRECSRFPCAVPVAAGGWDGAALRGSGPARIRPCHTPWEFSGHAVKHLEAGLGRASASSEALGFPSVLPERNAPRMWALPSEGNPL